MKIKTLKIDGFRSFKSTVIDPFDPQCTLVCGINGAGKSGVFEAIKFVLHIPGFKWERSKVVNNNDTRIDMASVTIEIDDELTPVPIIIRREMSRTGAEATFINDKSATESEVHNVLSGLGYFASNPYNIISQNQVISIANYDDKQRMSLLRNASGVSIYEEKRRDAEKELEQADLELKNVNEYIQTITQQKTALNQQVKDIEIQDHNLVRKDVLTAALKTISLNENKILHDKLVADIKTAMTDRDTLNTTIDKLKSELVTIELERTEIRESLDQKHSLKNSLNSQLETLKADQSEMIIANAQLKRYEAAQNTILEIESKIAQESSKLMQTEAAIQKLQREINDLNIEYKNVQVDIEAAEAIDVLPEGDEDGWKQTLLSKMEYMKTTISEAQNSVNESDSILKSLNEQQNELEIKASDLANALNESANHVTALEKQEADLEKKLKQDKIANVTTQNQLEAAKKQLERSRKDQQDMLLSIYSKTSPAITKGIITLRKLVASNPSISGVYGTLMELITNGTELSVYIPALEAVAGNQLYNIVVDTASTAKTLVSNFVKISETISINFKPLDRLKTKNFTYPDSYVPLISKIKYNSKFDDAFQDIFGGVIVVKDIEEGVKISDEHNIDCVTISGDLIQKNGVIVTASRQSSSSRLNAYADYCKMKRNHADILTTVSELNNKLITSSVSDNSIYIELTKARQALATHQAAKSRLDDEMNELRKNMELTESDRESFKTTIHQSEAAVKKYQSYLNMNYSELLTIVEKLSQASLRREELIHILDAKQADISKYNLTKRASEMQIADLVADKQTNMSVKPPSITVSPSQQFEISTEVEQSMADVLTEISELQSKLEKLTKDKSDMTTQLAIDEQRYQNLESNITNISIQEAEYLTLLHELETEIHELELDADQQSEVETLAAPSRIDSIREELSTVNNEIGKLPNVSKKAVTEAKKLEKELKSLTVRKDECERSKTSILNTMQTFDDQKQSTLITEAHKLADAFGKIFNQLTNTEGHLDILTEDGNLVGLKPNVSFIDSDKNSALSGGQKTLVSIAFIFALQFIEKAPFVILDESDAALDATYRAAVSRYISGNENDVQYLITTFSKELLEPCNIVWLIENQSRHSQARCISKNEAIQKIFTLNSE